MLFQCLCGLEPVCHFTQADDEPIFISARQENLIPLFSLHPYEYFLKPLNREKIEATLDSLYEKLLHDSKDIVIISNREKTVISAKKIKYIQSDGRRLRICYFNNKEIKCYMKLDELCEMLYEKTSDIIRIHTSYAVNTKYIIKRTGKSILTDIAELPISKKYRKSVDSFFSGEQL